MGEQPEHPKAKWAQILGVSRSGYYTWINEREQRIAAREQKTQDVIRIFQAGEGHYGADRICGIIRSEGGHASFGKIRQIMLDNQLKSSHCRRRQRSLTNSRKARGDEYKNLTRDLKITKPLQVISSDISYIRTGEGFDYLCQIQDVLTNTVLASCQQATMTADLVLNTLKSAKNRWHLPADTIFHSDRGSQYTAKQVMSQIAEWGWQQSFSRVGTPGDNAWSESFFSILKKEIIHWHYYPTREAARQRVFEYIEAFYNRKRVQKRLGYKSPIQYLSKRMDGQLQSVA